MTKQLAALILLFTTGCQSVAVKYERTVWEGPPRVVQERCEISGPQSGSTAATAGIDDGKPLCEAHGGVGSVPLYSAISAAISGLLVWLATL